MNMEQVRATVPVFVGDVTTDKECWRCDGPIEPDELYIQIDGGDAYNEVDPDIAQHRGCAILWGAITQFNYITTELEKALAMVAFQWEMARQYNNCRHDRYIPGTDAEYCCHVRSSILGQRGDAHYAMELGHVFLG